jgi:fatty-acid desaturase
MPDPSALILSVKFCDQETATHLRTQERNKRFSTLQLLITIFPFCHVLFGAICHVLLFVMFSLAPYLSLPELVLVRMYTFLVTMFGNPSADSTDPKNMV